MVLLLYCIRLPRAAWRLLRVPGRLRRRLGSSAVHERDRPARPTAWQDGWGEGGPRSATALSPRSLRVRVRPDVRLETPPRIRRGRAPASGHRAVPKHEARLSMGRRRAAGRREDEGRARQRCTTSVRPDPCSLHGIESTEAEFDIVPTVEANGNKPISPLSVAAEPRCVSVRTAVGEAVIRVVPPEESSCAHPETAGAVSGKVPRAAQSASGVSASGAPASGVSVNVRQVADCGRLRGASIHRAK